MDPLSREYEKSLSSMSPFEIKNKLIALAQDDTRKSTATFLNACLLYTSDAADDIVSV